MKIALVLMAVMLVVQGVRAAIEHDWWTVVTFALLVGAGVALARETVRK